MSGLLDLMQHSVWAMEPRILTVMGEIVYGHIMGVRRDAAFVQGVTRAQTPLELEARGGAGYVTRGRVAVIPIGGVVAKYASQINGSSQPTGTSVELIRQALRSAINDPNIDAGMLMFDTPGGMIEGIGGLHREIMQIDADIMPIEAYIDDQCCSAGTYIASAARRITATHENTGKSIGVYSLWYDASKWYEEQGVTVHLIASGPFKGAGAEGPPIPKEHLEKAKSQIMQHKDAFVEAMHRGSRGKHPLSFFESLADGSTSINGETLSQGLCDELAPIDAVLERMNAQYGGRSSSSTSMHVAVAASGAGNHIQTNTLASPVSEAVSHVVESQVTEPAKPAATPAGGTVMDPTKDADASTRQATTLAPKPAGETTPKGEGGGESAKTGDEMVTMSVADLKITITEALADVKKGERATAKANIEKYQAIATKFAHHAGVQTLLKAAISNPIETSVDAFRAEVLDAVAEATPPTGSILSVGDSGSDRKNVAIENCLLERHIGGLAAKACANDERGNRIAKILGFDDSALYAKAMAEATSAGLRHMRLQDIAQQCMAEAGHASGFGSPDEILHAAVGSSTGDFPKILSNVANKSLQAGFNEVNTVWESFCRPTNMNDFKKAPFLTMSAAANLLELPEGERPDLANFFERREQMELKTYGRAFGFTRKMFIDDDLGAFVDIPNRFGRSASRLPDILVFALIATNPSMEDGVPLFHATHKNLGAGTALSATALKAVYVAMGKQTDFGEENGDVFLDIVPTTIVVPTSLFFKAKGLHEAEFDPDAAAGEQRNVPNLVRNIFNPVSSPRLEAQSTTAYYAFADPNDMPAIQVGFLNGNRAPILTPVGDGSILERKHEVIFDCGVGALNAEGAYKDPGA